LIVSKEAAADLVRLREFLMDRNPGAAQRAAAAISNAIRSLGMYPEVNLLSPMHVNWSYRSGAQPISFGTLF
jgi:plasmid stabilization system protein ParE